MKTVNDEARYMDEDEGIYTVGDEILNQFYYGNYSDAVNMMIEDNIEPNELADYLIEKSIEFDCNVSDLYNNHFTLDLFANIGMSYVSMQSRKVA